MLKIILPKKYLFLDFFPHLNGAGNSFHFYYRHGKLKVKYIYIQQENVGMIKVLWYPTHSIKGRVQIFQYEYHLKTK
jgi:hypothetical protein